LVLDLETICFMQLALINPNLVNQYCHIQKDLQK